jgi:hypothetical protein
MAAGPQPAGGPGPQFNIPQADFGAWGMNDATAQFGMQLGQSAVNAGQQYVERNVRRTCFPHPYGDLDTEPLA